MPIRVMPANRNFTTERSVPTAYTGPAPVRNTPKVAVMAPLPLVAAPSPTV